MIRFITVISLAGFLLVAKLAIADYGYPIENAFAATIIGTPASLKISRNDLSERQPAYVQLPAANSQFDRPIDREYAITLFPERVIPDIFWYEQGGLKYSIASHNTQAPLIFIIAGTGASYRSTSVKKLQKIFYQVGYHVVSISSPTVPNFMYNASTSVIPGNLTEDSRDIFHVMKSIMKKHSDLPVKDYYLTGYSLGASHAAFVSKLDDQEHYFQFKKVLLINPPLSLANSVDVLDKMFEDNIPGGINRFNEVMDEFVREASYFYRENEALGVGLEFFYKMFRENPPTEEQMKLLIGFVFRISSAGMIFGVDVYNQLGFIVPKNQVAKLRPASRISGYAKIAHRLGFNDYIEQFYIPIFNKKTGMSRQELINQSSLESIKDYLQNTTTIGMMHNIDDPILQAGEIDTLKALFPERSIIYPLGGHLGNLEFKDNVLDMLDFFQGKLQPGLRTRAAMGEVQ
jgi:predicted alpha/beta-fold hydrolase